MRYFVPRSKLIKFDEDLPTFSKGLQSAAYSAQFDGLIEVHILGELVPEFKVMPWEPLASEVK